jgi:hypothetical protein
VLTRGTGPIGVVPSFEMKVPIDLIAPRSLLEQYGRRGWRATRAMFVRHRLVDETQNAAT